MTDSYIPLSSLNQGHWFKLICGASFQHLPTVRNLTLAYTLAGADCIDVAADPAVIASVREALEVASKFMPEARERGIGSQGLPWLMVSLNDGEDPHFRKAEFNQTECPPACPRPCESICPAKAIVFDRNGDRFSGVVSESCYGCGRCLPICPSQLIYTRSYVSTPSAIAHTVLSSADAVEIHTQVGRLSEFKRLWEEVQPWVVKLKLVAVSCHDSDGILDYLWSLHELITPLPCPLIWQTDGRPMSGDIGDGTTINAVKLGKKVCSAGLSGHVQLAGGTNGYTVAKLKKTGLLPFISGIAYGSYARGLLLPIFEQLEQKSMNNDVTPIVRLEEKPELLWQAVELAHSLVFQLKSSYIAPHVAPSPSRYR